MLDLSQARVGVIGGSGLYTIPGLEQVKELTVGTPWGQTSGCSLGKSLQDGDGVSGPPWSPSPVLPREVPHQANIWAMRQLIVRWLISEVSPWTPAGASAPAGHFGA